MNRKPQTDEERTAKLEALHEKLTDQVAALVDSDEWLAMLRMAARLHKYSFGNICAIMAQRPDATQVAGFNTWKSLGRSVNKGEKGIAILAPVKYRAKDEDGKVDQDSPYRVGGFRIEYVFDIRQSDGPEIPNVQPMIIEGEAPENAWDDVADRIREAGYRLRRGECQNPSANGETNPTTKTVTVRADLPNAQASKTLAHECAHIVLGHVENMAEYRLHRGRMEVEAESVAFLVIAEYGLDTSEYSVKYTAGWSDGDVKVIRETAERVISAARAITSAEPIAA